MSENKEFQKVLDKAKSLENVNFSDESEFNHDEFYGVIEKIANQNQSIKDQEAETVIQNLAAEYINLEFINELNKKKKTVEDFIRKYDPNKSDFLKGIHSNEVDKIYAISNYLLNAYIQYVNEMDFDFTLRSTEIKYINNILMKEIEYDGDEVFNLVQLLDDFWTESYKEYDENKNEKDEFTFKVSIQKILILHHLIKGHKEKGIAEKFKIFRNVLYKIAQTNKVFNAYSIVIERIKSEREIWGNALDHMWRELNPEMLAEEEAKMAKKNDITPLTEDEVKENLG